ncbi:MAG: DotA/TraY family protein [Alphaproteobacteria bacterium]
MSTTRAKTIGAKQVASYVIMPGILPRLKEFLTSGFGYVAFLMAQIYAMTRLLPPTHPYLNPDNIGKFTLRNTIAEAANNITLKRENIDQIAIFVLLLLGITLLALQIIVLILGIILGPVMAQAIFVTANPEADIAFMLLDQVFGIPNFFNSCISTGGACPGVAAGTPLTTFPQPFHLALHELFRFYSYGMLAVGTLIFLYFVVVVVLETATTGTPFGQRFQNVWVPIRLIMAIGLLIPLNYGMNTGQYITLYAAKAGSSFATNGWLTYNNAIAARMGAGANPTGEKESLIGLPTEPSVAPLVQAISLAHACAFSHWLADENTRGQAPLPPNPTFKIRPYLVKNPTSWMSNQYSMRQLNAGTPYTAAMNFFEGGNIVITFGEFGAESGPHGPINIQKGAEKFPGYVIPHCGSIRIPIITADILTSGSVGLGPEKVQEMYFNLVKTMWDDPHFAEFAQYSTARNLNISGSHGNPCTYTGTNIPTCPDPVTAEWKQTKIDEYKGILKTNIRTIWNDYINNTTETEISQEILDRGWGGAGIWFNTISQLNGAFMDAVINLPILQQYPLAMEKVRSFKRTNDAAGSTTGIQQFNPVLSNGISIDKAGLSTVEKQTAINLNNIFIYWNKEDQDQTSSDTSTSGNILEDSISLIFGAQAMFEMADANNQVHPLAQLTMLGKGLVESTIRNVATATIGSAFGGLLRAVDGVPASIINAVSGFIMSTAFIGLTAGLVLYYILPFLPFIYFFFAVGSWVKGIFEAMVATPLWALAHLRIDGEGLPGNSAMNGYFLIFEIFIRPILVVTGLVAAIVIFTAQVRVLNFIWQLVVDNLAGFDGDPSFTVAGIDTLTFQRGPIDDLFFTIVYAIIVYMMATAAFKLIDNIPKEILRWMGGGVSAFADQTEDPAAGLTRYAALGGMTAGQQMAKGIQESASGASSALGGALAKLGAR